MMCVEDKETKESEVFWESMYVECNG
jgi:hypothetical protein